MTYALDHELIREYRVGHIFFAECKCGEMMKSQTRNGAVIHYQWHCGQVRNKSGSANMTRGA